MKASALFVLACSVGVDAASNLRTAPAKLEAALVNSSATEMMNLASRQYMEVDLGPFKDAAAACDYCFGSFTKKGDKPAGPVAPFCVCMAYPTSGGHNMFCATPPSSAGYVAEKGGCRCKAKDMEAMGQTTCKAID